MFGTFHNLDQGVFACHFKRGEGSWDGVEQRTASYLETFQS